MKRIITFLLAFVMICSAVVSASAKMLIQNGDWMLEKLDNNIWEIDEYTGSDSSVTLINSIGGHPVSAVGDNAFVNNSTLETVISDNTLTTIGDYAFNGCGKLRKISLTSALTSIGIGTFANTNSLSEINLSDTSIDKISAYSFSYSGITELALPQTCTSIGNCAFQHCVSLRKISIPAGVTEISDKAFVDAENVVIYAPMGSCAQYYAKANDIEFCVPDFSFIVGDADRDGKITVLDATLIQRVLAKLSADDSGYIDLAGDVNRRGLEVTDATCIQRYLAKIKTIDTIGTIVSN